MNTLVLTTIIGAGATLAIDLWALIRRLLFGIALPNYSLVGRWIALMPQGRFRHKAITAASPIRGEVIIGWAAHYLIGIAFAALLTGIWGLDWIRHPTIGPAIMVGLGTVLAPFLIMQPAMGSGIAASRSPRPTAARLQSLITHMIFGLGLYAAAWLTHRFLRI